METPADTDPNSTNCLMNAFANQTHIKQFGFHPYAFELQACPNGVMSREEVLNASTNQHESSLQKSRKSWDSRKITWVQAQA